jgi:hypothetical protein
MHESNRVKGKSKQNSHIAAIESIQSRTCREKKIVVFYFVIFKIPRAMPIDDWDDDKERSVLEIFNENLVAPLFSAPIQTVQATTKTLEYVGSRSRIQIDKVANMSKSLLDGREREKTCGLSFSFAKKKEIGCLHFFD